MAISITEDLVASSSFRYDYHGARCARVFVVQGLSGSARSNPYLATFAVDDTTGASIPRRGQPHPDIPGLYVDSVRAEPLTENARTAQRVVVEYAVPELAPNENAVTIEITGSNGQRHLSVWQDGPLKGERILIPYNPDGASHNVPVDPRGLNRDPATNGGNYYGYAQFNVLSPNTVVRFTRREYQSPIALSLKYRRTLNASPWQGGQKGVWLCRAIDGHTLTSIGAVSAHAWIVTYEFEADPTPYGWSQVAYFVDKKTGAVPVEISVKAPGNNGWVLANPYPYADFNDLRLPNIT